MDKTGSTQAAVARPVGAGRRWKALRICWRGSRTLQLAAASSSGWMHRFIRTGAGAFSDARRDAAPRRAASGVSGVEGRPLQTTRDLSVGDLDDWFDKDSTPPPDDRLQEAVSTQPVVIDDRWVRRGLPETRARLAGGLSSPLSCDVAIVGAGAAGLATAIFARRLAPSLRVSLLDTARKPGAKILVSGGSRCNVTNAVVSDRDFWGGRRTIVRQILRALPVSETVAFFRELGVPLHEEADGKLFPDSNRARDVLDALLRESSARGVQLLADHRVLDVARAPDGFTVSTARGDLQATAVVLATGGRSLPKSGSDGAGYAVAERLGHTSVPTTPGLAPLLLSLEAPDSPAFHTELSGVAHEVELTVWIDGAAATRLTGALLWTHFGVSGPAALNASRHWARAHLEGKAVAITASFCPGRHFAAVDATPDGARQGSGKGLDAHSALDARSASGRRRRAPPARDRRRVDSRPALTRESAASCACTRRMAASDCRDARLQLRRGDGGRAGADRDRPGAPWSRASAPGLYLVGEILDVDGRIGGFNFQWAWATAHVAARGLAAAFREA